MWGEVEIFFVGEVIIASIDWAENTIYIDISTMNIVDIRPNVWDIYAMIDHTRVLVKETSKSKHFGSGLCTLHQRSKLIAENIEQLIMRMSVISQKPTRSEYVRLLYSGSPPARDNIWWCEVIGLLRQCTPGRCSLAASGSEAQPNSAQSLPEIVLCTAVHCCRRLQRMLHSAMNSVPSPSPGLCPLGSGGQSSLPHCPDPFHINTTKMYTNGAAAVGDN